VKPETQIKIARTTSIILIFVLLAGPGFFLYDKITTEGEDVSPKMALKFIGIMYILMTPLIFLCSIYIWVLKRRKFKLTIFIFSLHLLWAISASIISGFGIMIIEMIIIVLLLQGVLAIRKLERSEQHILTKA